jgi:hypothetical protein
MDRQQYQGRSHTAGEVKRDSGETGQDSDIPMTSGRGQVPSWVALLPAIIGEGMVMGATRGE